jgi:excisionase family DNA binding protein
MADHGEFLGPPAGGWLRVTQAATILGVDPSCVRGWCADGRVEATKLPGGHWRLPADAVKALLPRAGESRS